MFGEVKDIEKTAKELLWVSEGKIKMFQVKKKGGGTAR